MGWRCWRRRVQLFLAELLWQPIPGSFACPMPPQQLFGNQIAEMHFKDVAAGLGEANHFGEGYPPGGARLIHNPIVSDLSIRISIRLYPYFALIPKALIFDSSKIKASLA